MNSDFSRAILWCAAISGVAAAPVVADGPKGQTPPSGAAKHWAFQPVRNVEPPADDSGWSANPIDRFVCARLRSEGLEPAGHANKRTLIRRVTFDLIGLPPAPADVDAFLTDRSPDAFATVVDRLLASPQYGERWGRHWLDVVRYADTAGFEHDFSYANAWRYRDYVIRSFNADKPFDRFIQEQVAGDELWPGYTEALAATGMYCVGPAMAEAAFMSHQLEYDWLTDAADTTGAAFLGLTFGCARCHDHKYDPLTQWDYYGMQAIFAASDRPFPPKICLNRIKALNGLLSDAPVPKEVLKDPRCTLHSDDQAGMHLFHRTQPWSVHRLRRGELSKPREEVGPAFPEALLAEGNAAAFAGVESGKRRAQLAAWLTSPENPLTARVLVNRVWGWHFGQGLVRTPNDFGTQGERPTHPDLLDWLARDFMDHGWSLKRLHRLIVLSATYRQDSLSAERGAGNAELGSARHSELRDPRLVDPENRLLWHFPRRRLEGEAIRDTMLVCAGTLNLKPAGVPVVPLLDSQELTGLFGVKEKWPVTPDAREHTRRSVYLLVRRTFLYPMFAAFDAPEVMTSCPHRTPTVVPAQALTLLNSPLARQQSVAFARRLLEECGDRPEEIIARAWSLAFSRPATRAESECALTFWRKRTAAAGEPGGKPSRCSPREAALAELCLALFNANEFIYVD
jgi:hypothetical protein